MNRIHPREPQRFPLAHLPTPLVRLPRLAEVVGLRTVLMKRDDLTGLELTGNKVRKLEYLLADALAQGCDTLVTLGAVQSNHCRATAAVGAKLGMRVRLLLRSSEPGPALVGNLLLDRMFGAEVSLHDPEEFNHRRQQLVQATLAAERAAGRKPCFFGIGGSTPLGCWGYIRCMAELAEQLDPRLEYELFLPLSSCGTLTGVLLGRELFHLENVGVTAVLVSDNREHFQRELPLLFRQTAEQFDLPVSRREPEVTLLDGFIGPGYGLPTEAAVAALRLLARREAILLDPVYTAKAMAGMLDRLSRQPRDRQAIPVFLHTGGVFGMLAWPQLLAAGLAGENSGGSNFRSVL
ncbi:MAG: D-cysteine desulfhydrase family protein [Phycisphaerales bacterium]|nr:D-cysteine desulfhydrase family protein [Phycisphaerales bacterium]